MSEVKQMEQTELDRANKANWERYGTTNPENEFHSVWDEGNQTYEFINVKKLVDSVNHRIDEITEQRRVEAQARGEQAEFQNLKKELSLQMRVASENRLIKVTTRKRQN